MDFLSTVTLSIGKMVPCLTVILLIAVVLASARFAFRRFSTDPAGSRLVLQAVTILVVLVGMVALVLVLPVGETTRGHLLGFLGILLSAVIALSSTTFVGNALAGVMLRVTSSFRMGDFIRVGEHFGRVSERGLLHIEIQTELRDLTTLPNLYLITNPVQVIRSSGTIVSATVSLGYDVLRTRVEALLLEAARAAELQDPFVHVLELGDFSVTYRVAGLLTEVKQILTVRSNLRESMLDGLHGAGIEIVSPTFMNQRAIPPEKAFIPSAPIAAAPEAAAVPEVIVFDKADQAESLQRLHDFSRSLERRIETLKKRLGETKDEIEQERLKTVVERWEQRRARCREELEKREQEKKNGEKTGK